MHRPLFNEIKIMLQSLSIKFSKADLILTHHPPIGISSFQKKNYSKLVAMTSPTETNVTNSQKCSILQAFSGVVHTYPKPIYQHL